LTDNKPLARAVYTILHIQMSKGCFKKAKMSSFLQYVQKFKYMFQLKIQKVMGCVHQSLKHMSISSHSPF
jgi:hypothetical protein